jgi:prolyl-tRNA editing enzyme YbaK/EbsC (Cys-tRNA(Pro) deacylase)
MLVGGAAVHARPDARFGCMPETTKDPAIARVRDAAAAEGATLEVVVFGESTHTAQDAANALGCELAQIVKSLVFVAPNADGGLSPVICLLSGSNRVDPARLASVSGEPGVRRATAREAHDLTGFSIGGIPPFGHRVPVRVFMDPDLARFDVVWAAAGTGTAVFPMAPRQLAQLSRAIVAGITEARATADA